MQSRFQPYAVLICAAAFFLLHDSALGQSCYGWQRAAISGTGGNAAFDSARGVTVYVGTDGDTWEWDGNSWHWVSDGGPSRRQQTAMAYDARRGVTVLFGGNPHNPSAYVGDTWEWDGSRWVQRLVSGPSARARHAMAYDPSREVIVLFGGQETRSSGSSLDDTWEWDGTQWTQRTSETAPGRRVDHAMCYNGISGAVLLTCGRMTPSSSSDGDLYGDAWEYDGTTWTQLAAAPSRRSLPAMSYDSDRHRVVLAGGSYSDDIWMKYQTWEYDGASWTRKTSDQAGFEYTGAIAVYDTLRHRTLAVGVRSYQEYGCAALEWDGTSWAFRAGSPSGRVYFGMAYDTWREETVMFGGGALYSDYPDTWTYSAGTWLLHRVSRPNELDYRLPLAFDTARAMAVHFGGSTCGRWCLQDVWEWNGAGWTRRDAADPDITGGFALAYDRRRGRTVLFGGRHYNDSSESDETYEWTGQAWLNRSVPGPSARLFPAMAYDTDREVMVLFGGYTYAHGYYEYLGDTWEYDGTAWTNRPASGPAGRYSHAMAYDPVRKVVVMVGGWGGSGEMWEWDGTSWSRLTPNQPGGSTDPGLVYDEARQRLVYFSGSTGRLWELGSPDEDCDHVVDMVDECRGTIPGVSVDRSGCPPPVPGDFEGDGDVDADDLEAFQACASGPGIPQMDSACEKDLLDADDDVDQSDFGILQRCLSGLNVPADPSCAE